MSFTIKLVLQNELAFTILHTIPCGGQVKKPPFG